jgi:hypothetical protein
MWRSEPLVRILSEVAYGSCVIAFLFYFYAGSCGRLRILRLALAIVALDSIASSFGWVSNRTFSPLRNEVGYTPVFTSLLVGGYSSLLVGGCLALLPFWLFQGYGHFRFEYTTWNVNCLFTEGYAISFPVICAPVFAVMTFCREIGIAKILRPKP